MKPPEFQEYEIYDGLTQDSLSLSFKRYASVTNSYIKRLELINCQRCIVSGNKLGSVRIGFDYIPEYRVMRKLRERRFKKRYGSHSNLITNNTFLTHEGNPIKVDINDAISM